MTVTSANGAQPRPAKTPTLHRTAGTREFQSGACRSFLAAVPAAGTAYTPQEPATQDLQAIIVEHGYHAAFTAAIERVAAAGVPELADVHTLDQFFYYLDALVTWIPETRVWYQDDQAVHERTVYLRIVQLYYYFNQPELIRLQSPVEPGVGDDLTPVSRWLRAFAVAWGAFLDTPASAQHLASFKNAPEYNWQDFEKPPEAYASFNAFFARRFADIDWQRPVARAEDDRVIVFPAESTFVGHWAIATRVASGPLPAPPSITVKHIRWPIDELLADSDHAEAFAGGLFAHSFLNTYDYHRLHTPVAGRVIEARFIPGQVYLQVGLQTAGPDTTPNGDLANVIVPTRYLDADDPTGYQFVQCRGLLVLETPRLGKVAVLPMGMAQVSSIVFTDPAHEHSAIALTAEERAELSYTQQVTRLNERLADRLVGQTLHKGEMFAFFQFGGSDCVVVFERRANVTVTAAKKVHYPVRSQYAVANFDA